MKPLNFLSLFALYFVMLILLGIVFSLIDNGKLSAIIYIGLVGIFAALILAALTIKIRAIDPQNVSKLFKLNFIFWFCFFLAQMVLNKLSEISELTYFKIVLLIGISVLGAFFCAKVAVMSLSKKLA
jgi:hypothetical protein